MPAQPKNKRPPIQKPVSVRKETVKRKNLLLRSVPVYVFLLLTIIPVCTLGLYFHFVTKKANSNRIYEGSTEHDQTVKVVRGNGKVLIHPLLFVEIESEKVLDPLKIKINNYLEQKKQENAFMSTSVYVKDLNAGRYMSINPDSLYDPASILKVPLLIIYLKQAETNPGILKKSLFFKGESQNVAIRSIKDQSLVAGRSYTVEELLHYMIVYSDNEAFWMLCENIGDEDNEFKKLDAELDIPEKFDIIHYPASDQHFIASANSVAHYFNVLYNASYLNNAMSEYALNLLTKSNFKEGIIKQIDPGVTIAHKFGERTLSYMQAGKSVDLLTEFHEFGIVYLKNRPYLIGVMTRGMKSNALQTMVSDISKIVYDELKAN
ncbi:MAG: serine hydrolase [Bacteroidota bacterium]